VRTYELAFNWPHAGHDAFTDAVARAARARHVRFLRVTKGEDDSVRGSIDRRTLRVGLFLNTQADGLNMESPRMLLCRVLKSSGTHVVEDPDDSPVYTDRALGLDYLRRSGLSVPPYAVVETRQRERPPEFPVRRSKLGANWVARPARGMGRNRIIIRGSRSVASSVSRSKLHGCPKVVVMPLHRAAVEGERELRFLVWHLFGHVLVCRPSRGSHSFELAKAGELAGAHIVWLAGTATRMREVTGLDWFVTEIVAARTKGRLDLVVVEPPNALAGLGPGAKALVETPEEVIELAAERIVEVAWRRSQGLPLSEGVKIVTAADGKR
jgi:hypothetical protein